MARSFNGTSNYLKSASTLTALAGTSRLSIGFWHYGTFGANNDEILLEYGANAFLTTNGLFAVVASPSAGAGAPPWIYLNAPTHDHSGTLPSTPSSNAWHHWLLNFDLTLPGGTLEVGAFFDGVAQTLASTDGSDFSNTGATFIADTLNLMSRNGSSLFCDGRLSDLCIWSGSTVLGSTEATALANGARANTVRNSEILYYWPLAGTTSPEPASIGSTALNVTGATFVADPPALAGPPLTFTVTKTDSTHTSVSWTASDPTITHGVSIVRCAGDKTTTADGNGVAVGAAGYDPTTIAGATTVASAVTSSPYADTVPTPGTYTYWINRTA